MKWEQYDKGKLIRCGEAPFPQIMAWMRELGKEAKEHVKTSKNPHALYGRIKHDEDGRIIGVRYYCDSYCVDDEILDELADEEPLCFFYVAHRAFSNSSLPEPQK